MDGGKRTFAAPKPVCDLADDADIACCASGRHFLNMVALVVPHDPRWAVAFLSEASAITAALKRTSIVLHHIGSTAISGILSKPIIDLLGVVLDLEKLDEETDCFESLGYVAKGEYGIDGRRYFRKHNLTGQRTHHLHVFAQGSSHIERHLAFRDFLRAHPRIAAEYSDLKARLTSDETKSWEKYSDGKAPFINATEADAIAWFRNA